MNKALLFIPCGLLTCAIKLHGMNATVEKIEQHALIQQYRNTLTNAQWQYTLSALSGQALYDQNGNRLRNCDGVIEQLLKNPRNYKATNDQIEETARKKKDHPADLGLLLTLITRQRKPLSATTIQELKTAVSSLLAQENGKALELNSTITKRNQTFATNTASTHAATIYHHIQNNPATSFDEEAAKMNVNSSSEAYLILRQQYEKLLIEKAIEKKRAEFETQLKEEKETQLITLNKQFESQKETHKQEVMALAEQLQASKNLRGLEMLITELLNTLNNSNN